MITLDDIIEAVRDERMSMEEALDEIDEMARIAGAEHVGPNSADYERIWEMFAEEYGDYVNERVEAARKKRLSETLQED